MYTISDFYNSYRGHVKLIAGAGGLSHPVSTAGFLDYELVPALKNKYFHSNFIRDQLLLTSFLYAKDSPYDIIDAVKHLISKGCSGLVIRNVFRIPVSDMLVRYADSKNFPVFLLESGEVFFEDIVYEIKRHKLLLEAFEEQNRIMDGILKLDLSPDEIRRATYQLNPSFSEQFFCVCCRFADAFPLYDAQAYLERVKDTRFDSPQTFMLVNNKGIYFICSGDNLAEVDTTAYVHELVGTVFSGGEAVKTGVSLMHNTLANFKAAIRESLYASLHCETAGGGVMFYDDLGSYKVIFPYAQSAVMRDFSRTLLEPLHEFDTCYSCDFYQTLRAYINCGNSVRAAAALTGMHEQSVRYRLKKICALLNADPKSASSMEQLSLAVKIQNAAELLDGQGGAQTRA